jgi:hypothetical protein
MTNHGQFQQGPIHNTGEVVINTFLDVDGIQERIENGLSGTSYYGNSNDKFAHDIEQGNMVFAERKSTSVGDLKVFATFNGFGNIGDSLLDIEKKIFFVGLAKFPMPLGYNDITGKYETADTSGSITNGGMKSLIYCNGTKHINAGDKIMWGAPSTQKITSRRDTRLYPVIKPYRPELDEMTRLSFIENVLGGDQKEDKYDQPIVEGTNKLSKALLHVGLIFLDFAIREGIVQTNNFSYEDKQLRQSFLSGIAEQLGIISDKSTSLAQKAKEHLFIRNPIELEGGEKRIPKGREGELYKFHQKYLRDIFVAIEKTNFHQKGKIFATAMESADPGQRFVVKFGRYIV